MTDVSVRTPAPAMPVHVGTHIPHIPKAAGIEGHFRCSRLSTEPWLVCITPAPSAGSPAFRGRASVGIALHHIFPAGASLPRQSESRGLPFPPASELPDTCVCTPSALLTLAALLNICYFVFRESRFPPPTDYKLTGSQAFAF